MSEQWGLLHLTVRDGAGKDLLPARIHIKRPDGTAYVPPCGLDDTFSENQAPPVLVTDHYRKNLHLCERTPLQSTHLTRGEATFPVPAGEFGVYVWKGFEWAPAVERCAVKEGETVHLAVGLRRCKRSAISWASRTCSSTAYFVYN